MDATLFPRRIAPLYGLVIGLLPVFAVLNEYWYRMHPLMCIAFLYGLGLMAYYTVREYRGEVRSGGHEGGHGVTRSAHLVLVAFFAVGFFGVIRLVWTFATGHQRWQLAAGDQVWQLGRLIPPEASEVQEAAWYTLALAVFAAVYWLAHRFPGVKFDLNLRWRWQPIDLVIVIGLSALTVFGLGLFTFLTEGPDALAARAGQWGSAFTGTAWIAPLCFAFLNAVVEEFWFRGLLQGALKPLLRPGRVIVVQALVFGLIHWFGTPSGTLGIILAGVWGGLLGWWVYKRGSLWPAVAVHFLADVIIFFLMN